MQRCHQWPNRSKRCLLLTKSNATKGKLFLEMSSLNFEVSYDTVPGWTLKGSVTQFLNFEGFCDTVRPNLRIAKLVSCVHLLLLLLLFRVGKNRPPSEKETKLKQKFELANWSALEPQRTPVWRGWVKYHKPQMFSTNSLILEITILCRDKNLLPMNQRWDVECKARQSEKTTLKSAIWKNHIESDKPHWN